MTARENEELRCVLRVLQYVGGIKHRGMYRGFRGVVAPAALVGWSGCAVAQAAREGAGLNSRGRFAFGMRC